MTSAQASSGGSATKPPSYYAVERRELVERLPRPLGRVLDLGCGAGAVGRSLRAAGPSRLVGVELDPDAAAIARDHYDEVIVGSAEVALREAAESFDTIVAYDVLEHLVDPWLVLRQLRALAAQGGRLHVSVPNASHVSLLRDLIVRGTFGYSEWGHRDNTHLRWFTRQDLLAALRDAGWRPTEVANSGTPGWRGAIGRATRRRSDEFLVLQWQVLSVADAEGTRDG